MRDAPGMDVLRKVSVGWCWDEVETRDVIGVSGMLAGAGAGEGDRGRRLFTRGTSGGGMVPIVGTWSRPVVVPTASMFSTYVVELTANRWRYVRWVEMKVWNGVKLILLLKSLLQTFHSLMARPRSFRKNHHYVQATNTWNLTKYEKSISRGET